MLFDILTMYCAIAQFWKALPLRGRERKGKEREGVGEGKKREMKDKGRKGKKGSKVRPPTHISAYATVLSRC